MKTLTFSLAILLVFASQINANGSGAALRLLRQAVQSGTGVLPSLPEVTSRTLIDNFRNQLKAMGLPENATGEQFIARINELDLDAATRTRLLSALSSDTLDADNADELLSSMSSLTPGLMRTYYAGRSTRGSVEFFPCVTCSEDAGRISLTNLNNPEIQQIAGRVNLRNESTLNSSIRRLLRGRGISINREALRKATFADKAQAALVLNVAQSASDPQLRGLANAILGVRKVDSQDAGLSFLESRLQFESFLYDYDPTIAATLTKILNDTSANTDGQGVSRAFEASLMRNTEAEPTQIDDAVTACTRV